jgi:hypothetical protein
MIGDYDLLGVAPTASALEIKNAYGNVLKNNHPNINGEFDDVKVNKIMTAFKRIMAKQQPKNIQEKRFNEIVFPTMDVMCDQMEKKMSELSVDISEHEKTYYSKMSYFVRRGGKVFTKIEENVNGNLREYEEYTV